MSGTRKRTRKQSAAGSLELTADKALLAGLIDAAARVAKGVADAPIMTCARLALKGKTLQVTGTDLDVFVRTSAKVEGKQDGVVAVPARPLADLIKACPNDQVHLSIADGRLRVASGPFVAAMVTQPESEFPAEPTVEADTVGYSSDGFVAAIARVAGAASRDRERPLMTGVCFEPGERLTVVATDSYRLAVDEVDGTGPPAQVVLPTSALGEVLHTISREKAEAIEVAYGEVVGFTVGSTHLTVRPLEGEYPQYGRLIPADAPVLVNVGRKPLAESLGRMRLMLSGVTNVPSLLVLGSESLTVTAGGEMMGDATEALEADVVGPSIAVAFNTAYLLEALRAGEGDEVEFALTDGIRPALVTFPARPTYRHVLMPVKIADGQNSHQESTEPEPESEEPTEVDAEDESDAEESVAS